MMNHTPLSPARRLVLAGLMLALALVLPFLTGQLPQIGNMLCPMHLPVLLCGFLLGWPWGLAVGVTAPLLRSALFGMPPLYPVALAMCLELGCYGLVTGLLYPRVRHTPAGDYAVLTAAMVSGRLVWGAARFVMAGLSGTAFPLQAFLSGAIFTALPGILLQLVLIPLILAGLRRAKLPR